MIRINCFFRAAEKENAMAKAVEAAKAQTVEIAVQVKGKVRGRVMVALDAPQADVEAAAKEAVAAHIAGKTVKKVIYVPGKLVNIVAI